MISTVDQFRGQSRALRLVGSYLAADRLTGTVLLLGQRGLGKTTLATIIARALTCQRNTPPRLWFCGECYACRTIALGEQPEFMVLRPRGKEISVGQVEEDAGGFRSALYHPVLLSHRVFVIDDAHYLNEETGNQLLKVFEEAPARTVFLLVSDRPELLLPTIHSRGQKINLHPLATTELAELIAVDAPAPLSAALEAAQMAAGRYVDALALAREPRWRKAVQGLAARVFTGGSARLADALASFEYDSLWAKELVDRGLDQAAAEKLMADSKSDVGKGLKTRRREVDRQALITAYDRASWWALQSAAPPGVFLDALSQFKARVNQNVDIELARAAFEISLGQS